MGTVLEDTTTSNVDKTLSRLRAETGVRTLGRVLTLVIIAETGHSEKAVEAAIAASREHPCRIIVHVAHDPGAANRLDAEINLGGEAGASEVVILRGWGESAHASESLLAALLLPDVPIVVWWPHSLPGSDADDSMRRIASRRITDSARAEHPWKALTSLRETYRPGDTDLAWTRLTQWRIQLAAVLDDLPREATRKVVVEGSERSPSVILLGTWLGYKLDAEVEVVGDPRQRGLFRVTLCREGGDVTIHRPGRNVATLSQPGSPDQQIALPVRSLAQCLAEELRRLDPDEAFGDVLTRGLSSARVTWVEGTVPEDDEAVDENNHTEAYDA
jgi:glucose-6-phosphate dehydrogenase assembly protein OpcA